jgi:hypothetical protein
LLNHRDHTFSTTMAPSIFKLPVILTAGLISCIALLYKPVALRVEVLGLNRPLSSIQNIHGSDLHVIPDTAYCEDMHYHEPSGLVFAACEENEENRWKWFPPMTIFDDPTALGHGSIVVIDPKTFTSTRLTLPDFPHPFITHGFDIYTFPDDPTSIYIFAANHLPNPDYVNDKNAPKARSQIEIFHHTLNTTIATHIRSIHHPLIRTPNDIYATSDHSFYVTNDHYYRDGPLKLFEDIAYGTLAPWTDLVNVEISDLHTSGADGVNVTVAAKGIHNNNGLGKGRDENEILIGRAAAGVLVLAKPKLDKKPELEVVESIQVGSTIDNPSYFSDPFAAETGRDASGYVLAGLARAAAFPDLDGMDSVMVWLVQHARDSKGAEAKGVDVKDTWTRNLIFQDDGKTIRSAATAVLVAVDPKENDGKKQAWLFVTGPVGKAVVASKIDL